MCKRLLHFVYGKMKDLFEITFISVSTEEKRSILNLCRCIRFVVGTHDVGVFTLERVHIECKII
jgi:hypothetical protein